jgi:hypothetical protein
MKDASVSLDILDINQLLESLEILEKYNLVKKDKKIF